MLITALGLFSLAMGCVCMAVRSLGEPDHRTTADARPVCPTCLWPQGVMPCLCPEDERLPQFCGGDGVGCADSELGTPGT